jgi:sulfide:quinone oxidoreductase
VSRGDSARVLIAGGGVAALEAALALQALAAGRVSVELLAPEPHFWYRPLSVAEPFELGDARHFELSDLAARAGATFLLGALTSVDTGRREAYTSAGAVVPFDVLLIACGAVPRPAIPGALTFRGPADTDKIRQLLAELAAGKVTRIAFAVPSGAVWSLPVYELALMTAAWLAEHGRPGVELSLVTPEDEPLQLFGRAASDAVRELLEERGIAVRAGVYPLEARDGVLLLLGGDGLRADRVVALPRLQGERIDGIPQTHGGFVPTDSHGRVRGLSDVYAAGDITNFPVKQGGIAAQQADAAAETIAAAAGADLSPEPFRPVVRGLLLTGGEPRYLRSDVAAAGGASLASPEPLWWPPAKIVGRHLAPFLAALTGQETQPEPAATEGVVRVEVELGADLRAHRLIEHAVGDALREAGVARVGDVMSVKPLVVAPEDTLGEIAEKMRAHDVGSALVADYGRLIGILTSRDLVRAFAGRVHASEARAREWMTAEPQAVPTGTTLEAAAFLMSEHHVHHLPVVEGERPVGMVGMRDVIRAGRPFSPGLGF